LPPTNANYPGIRDHQTAISSETIAKKVRHNEVAVIIPLAINVAAVNQKKKEKKEKNN